MIPHAKHAFNWTEAGGEFFNVVDAGGVVYADGSTISKKTVDHLGLPIVRTAEDEEELIRTINLAFMGMREIGGKKS